MSSRNLSEHAFFQDFGDSSKILQENRALQCLLQSIAFKDSTQFMLNLETHFYQHIELL